MPSKNNDKNKDSLRELTKNISPILVVNNNSLKPYVECFQYFPENIYQQPLGILTGFFEIKEHSEDSAYVVNFLNSVLKKEYYINPKRPVTESLDSALHKVNIALSELAKHGNVNWLGKLDGAVCILEKNNLHFSVAGDAKVLLCRKNVFNDISEGLAMESVEPNPLKTFVNVSSGRLENKDKLLITSNDIFYILTMEQLTKNAQRFPEDKFVQFLKTALSNELEMASVIVVDAMQKKSAPRKLVAAPEPTTDQAELVNVFSEKTFATNFDISDTATAEPVQPALEEAEYTDKKTGHIYIQGQEDEIQHVSQMQALLLTVREHATDFSFEAKKQFRRKLIALKKSASLLRDSASLQISQLKKERYVEEVPEPELTLTKPEPQEEPLPERHIPVIEEIEEPPVVMAEVLPQAKPPRPARKTLSEIKPAPKVNQEAAEPTTEAASDEPTQHIPVRQKISFVLDENDLNIGQEQHSLLIRAFSKLQDLSLACSDFFSQLTEHAADQSAQGRLKKLIPDFHKLKGLYNRFTRRQRAYVLLTVLAIIIVPLLFNVFSAKSKPAPIVDTPPSAPSLAEILTQDKGINLTAQAPSIAELSDLKTLLIFEDTPYAVTGQKIVALGEQSGKEFDVPLNQAEKVQTAVFMQDLNLFLILTSQQRVLSFSPISQQFKDNNIQFPANLKPGFIATYLTYLYVIDSGNNQIYRYPRAEGGFGEKTDWLKSNIPLANISALTIDDSLYFTQDNKLIKLFKGQPENINFENSRTPVTYSQIFTTIDLDNLYVLDAKSARVIVYAKTGEIVKQYFNEAFQDATSLTVSEKTASAYVATKNGVVKLAL